MIKVCFLIDPLEEDATVWKKTESTENPWIVIGKAKVDKASNWLIISLARVKEIIEQEEKKRRERRKNK